MEFITIDRAINDQSGGRYRVSFAEYRDRTLDRYSFRQWQVDLRQYMAFVKDTRIIALRAWAASREPIRRPQVPFYLQPTLGGGRTLRAYETFRFRDQSAVLLQAEYRWRVNEFVKARCSTTPGPSVPTPRDLGRLDRNYGFGLRAGGRGGSRADGLCVRRPRGQSDSHEVRRCVLTWRPDSSCASSPSG